MNFLNKLRKFDGLWNTLMNSCIVLLCVFYIIRVPESKSNSKVDTYATLAKTRTEFNAFTKFYELRKDNFFRIIIDETDMEAIPPKRIQAIDTHFQGVFVEK